MDLNRVVFLASNLAERYNGSFSIENNVIYINSGIDEFYCDLLYKTEKRKLRFYHRVQGQTEFHRQIDRKNLCSALYTCFTHKNKYIGIPYNRKERIQIQAELSKAWFDYKESLTKEEIK
jgi:hypothetical protein